MTKISALFRHPVKSCAGGYWNGPMEIQDRGPAQDRSFAVIGPDGKARTQRREDGGFTKMALITPMIVGGTHLDLWAPKTDSLTIPILTVADTTNTCQAIVLGETCEAIDQGEQAAKWFTNYLGVPCRLVRMADGCYRRVDPAFCSDAAQTSLNDGFPILLISDASLTDLNQRLEAKCCPRVTREHFRAAFWIDDCAAYEEDTWLRIAIGDIEFEVAKPCARCSITQVDWSTGTYRDDNEPLLTLGEYRRGEQLGFVGPKFARKIFFGQNLVHRGTGNVSIGNEVHILKRK